MAKRILYILGSSLLLLAFTAPATVAAVDSTTSSSSSSVQTTQTASEKAAAMAARIAQRKLEFKTKLTAAETKRLQDRCKPAQALIGSLNDKLGTSTTTRTQAYTELTTHITDILDKLATKNLDLETLKSNQAQLMVKINTYKADLATYKDAIGDLKDMDCAADATAFKASLEVARTDREKLATDVADIRTYVTGTVKPTLQTLHDQLAKAEGTTN